MTKFRVCALLVCLLVMDRAAIAAPTAATLLMPNGEISTSTIAFTWQAVPGSTWYLFWLGTGSPTSFVMEQWYSAEQSGCANGGTCTITMTPSIGAGSYVWFIRTWGADAFGPWSTGKAFVKSDPTPIWSSRLPDSRRFTLVMDGEAVLDNETGLVWDRKPSTAEWKWATAICEGLFTGSRFGWRLPTIAELSSLIMLSGLPAGHPFDLGSGGLRFWSDSTWKDDASYAFVIHLVDRVGGHVKTQLARFWCVRGPSGGS